ncbi:MAG: sugar transferase [Epsilonproteobacteria bacterium]|nr:sugar transferase [Campylobacterota bacterium]
MGEFKLKRLFDIILSIFLMVLLSPLFIIVSILIYIKMGRPILFRQVRAGFNEKLFTIYKFRTMSDIRDESGKLLPDDKRLDKFGKFIRATSLDELPQLLNVLKGDMSFVGPRPLLVEYLPLYSREQRRRHTVKPGITGLAQINGRNAIDWDSRFRYDIEYVDNHSFILDLKILWRTLLKVIKRDGVSADNHVTVEKFRGSN